MLNIIDPSLKFLDPIFINNKLIFTNIEELEEYVDIKEIKIQINEEDYDLYKGLEQPWKIEICDNCDGIGSHLNSSMRDHAYTQEELNEDPNFLIDMQNGRYDVTCQTCKGNGRYITVNHETAEDYFIDLLNHHYETERILRAEIEQERRMGY